VDRAGAADPIHTATSQNLAAGHVEEFVFERGAAQIGYENFHLSISSGVRQEKTLLVKKKP
jgi:hypothetical protein